MKNKEALIDKIEYSSALDIMTKTSRITFDNEDIEHRLLFDINSLRFDIEDAEDDEVIDDILYEDAFSFTASSKTYRVTIKELLEAEVKHHDGMISITQLQDNGTPIELDIYPSAFSAK